MRTKQDGIPTDRLPRVMALDAHGRVLRRPYFVTKEEHDAELSRVSRVWAELSNTERRKKEALTGAMQDLIAENEELNRENERLHSECQMLTSAKIGGVIKLRPKIRCRSRFHWVLRKLIRV